MQKAIFKEHKPEIEKRVKAADPGSLFGRSEPAKRTFYFYLCRVNNVMKTDLIFFFFCTEYVIKHNRRDSISYRGRFSKYRKFFQKRLALTLCRCRPYACMPKKSNTRFDVFFFFLTVFSCADVVLAGKSDRSDRDPREPNRADNRGPDREQR